MTKESAENWKQRYLDNLERLDEQEQKLTATEDLLRHGIARLSLVAQGSNPELNQRLEKLRKTVRGNYDPFALRALVDDLADAARKMDDSAADPGRDEVNRKGTELARELLQQLAERLLPHAGDSREQLVRRLRSAADDHELRAVAVDVAAAAGRTPQTPESGKAGSAAFPAHTALHDLLSSLVLPSELDARRDVLKEQLTGEIAAGQWPRILGAIAALIADMRARIEAEKAELENFLRQLTERLQELDVHMRGAEQSRQQSYLSGQDLGRGVQAEVSSMETSIRQATSIEQLKSVVQDRLEHIRQRVDEHRQTEERRQVEMEEKLRHVTTRLHSMEHETTRLRSDLEKRKIQATSDPLTGIPNRTAFEERLASEYGRWKRYRCPLALLILDIDHFKRINDNLGHKAGDKALQLIARVLRQQLREIDLLARYGGEEFVALLPDTAQEHVPGVVEKLRSAVEKCEFHHRGQRVPITMSCGYATFRAEDQPDAVFQRADEALYRAKAEGRNRACNGDGV